MIRGQTTRNGNSGIRKNLPAMLLTSFLITSMMIACSQFDGSVGGDVSGSELEGVLKDTVITLDSIAVDVIGDSAKSARTVLPFGRQGGFVSDIYYQFTNLDLFGDTSATSDTVLQLDSARFYVYGSGFYDSTGIENTSNWYARMYRKTDKVRIDSIFIESTESYARFAAYYYQDTLTISYVDSVEMGTFVNSDTISVPIPRDSLLEWVDAFEDRELCFRFRSSEDAGFLKHITSQLYSANADLLPALRVSGDFVVDGDTLTDTTLAIYPTRSSFMVHDEESIPQDRIVLSDGFFRRVLFHYPFAEFDPTRHSLNLAEVILFPDTLSENNYKENIVFQPIQLTSDWSGDPGLAVYGASGAQDSLLTGMDALRTDITFLMRYYVVSPDSNLGFAIRSYNDNGRIGRRVFFDQSAAPELRPKLHIIYTEFTD